MPQRISCFEHCLNATVYLTIKAQFHLLKYGKASGSVSRSIKMSEQTWNQHGVYILVSYLQVLAASRSRLFPGSLTCHTVLEKAHEEAPCPLTLQTVANLFCLSL